ncbi:recombination regulator RecX [Bacillus ectoiniformans]|uniref:recombination regulator RecX n=1 Tax=Bacillus ectoiniformans TaxID=1494429 RepID=UPI001958CBD0|nr:recombination regulator RecX [Bacillus ectoiniformans]
MLITKVSIQEKRKDRYNIFINEKYEFSVDESVLIRFDLKKGKELSRDELVAIERQDHVRKGLNMAIHYLSLRMRSEKEVADYLSKKEVEPEGIREIIATLYRLSYLNEAQFADAFVKTQINTTDKGPKTIERELKEKGLTDDLIEESLQSFDFDKQLEKAVHIAEKYRKKNKKESLMIQKQKIQQALVRKGYSWNVINEALEQLEPADDGEEQDAALMHQAEKVHRRYSKFTGGEYKQKMKQSLYRKGFAISDIDQAIERLQEDSD